MDQCQPAIDFFQKYGSGVNKCTGDIQVVWERQHAVDEVTCYKAGSNCHANTTFCLHKDGGHFGRPTFATAFPMHDEVFDFFARDACSITGGMWSHIDKRCTCKDGNYASTYCLTEDWHGHATVRPQSATSTVSSSSIGFAVVVLIFVMAVFYFLAREERKYAEFKMVSTVELAEFPDDDPRVVPEDSPIVRRRRALRLCGNL